MHVADGVPGARDSERARDVLLLQPTAFAAFLLLTIISAVASGGGRELLSRDQGVAFPVSPTTDHLGALLLAPLNIAWLMQAWVLLGSMAYGLPARLVPAAELSVLLWLASSTAIGADRGVVHGGDPTPAARVGHGPHDRGPLRRCRGWPSS